MNLRNIRFFSTGRIAPVTIYVFWIVKCQILQCRLIVDVIVCSGRFIGTIGTCSNKNINFTLVFALSTQIAYKWNDWLLFLMRISTLRELLSEFVNHLLSVYTRYAHEKIPIKSNIGRISAIAGTHVLSALKRTIFAKGCSWKMVIFSRQTDIIVYCLKQYIFLTKHKYIHTLIIYSVNVNHDMKEK